jgi:hypothetical protein
MVFSTTMSVKARLGFGIASTLPFLAPYELLIKPAWTDIPSLAWLFAFVVSLGAIAVSILLLLVAIFGMNRLVEFNATSKTIRITESHLMQRKQEFKYSFADVAQIEVISHDWTEGPSTYEIRLMLNKGKPFAFGDFSKGVDAESALSSLKAMIEPPQ